MEFSNFSNETIAFLFILLTFTEQVAWAWEEYKSHKEFAKEEQRILEALRGPL